jgi:isoquinoline 1-oxidoreductase beta subunit
VFTLNVNGQDRQVDAPAEMPLLWALRDTVGLRGTKYGCGVGVCGICAVHADGEPVRACVTTVAEVAGKRLVTIEGLTAEPRNRLIEAWLAERVSQCGYCQPGQIMAAAALLARHPSPTNADIDQAMSGVVCRCGTYQRIRRAIERAAARTNDAAAAVPYAKPPPPARPEVTLNPWIRIAADGTITLVAGQSEMGQGASTGLAMLVAEELDVDLAQIRYEAAPADRAYVNPSFGEQLTGGSTSIRAWWRPLREAAAAARERLIAAAADGWALRRKDCRAERGTVVHIPTGRRFGYGELAARAAALPAPRSVRLKQPHDFHVIGTLQPRLDSADHVTGRAIFGGDVSIPDMLVATVARCPVFGGKLAHVDARRARAIQGVRDVVEMESGVAVIAESSWSALRGRETLAISWDEGPQAGIDSARIRHSLQEAATHRGRIARDDGDAIDALRYAARSVEAVYETPYLAHATMEPMNCTARVGPDGCDVWAPTQAQTDAQNVAAQAAGLRRNQVRIHTACIGGGFGRRLDQDFVAEAVQIAKAVGRPVQVLWTRDDDMRHDHYRPANYTRLRGGLDAGGRTVAWFQRIVGPSLALDGVDVPYAIPNIREEHVEIDPGVPTGPWRSVGASQNAFAVECFIDELAHASRADPLAFRRKLLGRAPRHRGVLDLAAEKAGWGTPPPRGRHRGLAVYHSFGSYVAQVAEVSVSETGAIRVHRVVCAIDCGFAVNPDLVAAQMEGGIAFGLSAALKGEITVEQGAVVQASLRDFPILKLDEMPEVEVHIRASREEPGGVGEPGVPPIAPALANALFAATGHRIRALPIRALHSDDRAA